MNVGMIPYLVPTLFATSLNKTPLSAMRDASVYANAVSKTPGPVSVSGYQQCQPPDLAVGRSLTVRLDVDAKICRDVEQIVEIVHV